MNRVEEVLAEAQQRSARTSKRMADGTLGGRSASASAPGSAPRPLVVPDRHQIPVPIGPDRRVLVADSSEPGKMKWAWMLLGTEGFDQIELHDHDQEGFIHFYSPLASETFHGNLYQTVVGSGGAAQSEVVLHTSQLNGGGSGILRLRSQSEDGTIPASVLLNGSPIPSAANTVVTEFGSGQSSTSGVSSSFSRGDHTHGTPVIPAVGNTVVTEFAFGQSSTDGVSALYSSTDHTHGTPTNPVVTNHPRYSAVDGMNPNTTQVRMQAGNTVITTDASGNATINYGTAFPTGTLQVVVTNGDANAHTNTVFSLYGYVAGSFGVHCHVAHTNLPLANVSIRVHWIAVGY